MLIFLNTLDTFRKYTTDHTCSIWQTKYWFYENVFKAEMNPRHILIKIFHHSRLRQIEVSQCVSTSCELYPIVKTLFCAIEYWRIRSGYSWVHVIIKKNENYGVRYAYILVYWLRAFTLCLFNLLLFFSLKQSSL